MTGRKYAQSDIEKIETARVAAKFARLLRDVFRKQCLQIRPPLKQLLIEKLNGTLAGFASEHRAIAQERHFFVSQKNWCRHMPSLRYGAWLDTIDTKLSRIDKRQNNPRDIGASEGNKFGHMRDAEQKLEIVLDALDALEDGVLVLDEMVRHVAANKAYYDLVLTEDEQLEEGESSIRIAKRIIDGKRVQGINQMEHAEGMLTVLASTFSYVRDFEAVLTDGRLISVNCSPTDNGNTVMWFRDKGREQFGERRALDMLSEGLSSVDMGMVLWDDALIVQSLNQSWQSLVAAVDVGQNCRDMFAAMIREGRLSTDRPIYENDLDHLMKALHSKPMRLNLLAANQRQIQISTFFTRTRGIFATAVDVTEHRSAQEHARTMLSDVVQSLDVGIIHFDAEQELQLMNRAARETIYPDRKVPAFGTPLSEFATGLAEQCSKDGSAESGIASRLAKSLQTYDTPFRPDWANGRVLEFCAHRTELGGVMISVKDLTDYEAMQEELARQREITTQNEKLSALGELLAEVAHELSNPMSVCRAIPRCWLTRSRTQKPSAVPTE